jgi:hypothetical protein
MGDRVGSIVRRAGTAFLSLALPLLGSAGVSADEPKPKEPNPEDPKRDPAEIAQPRQ